MTAVILWAEDLLKAFESINHDQQFHEVFIDGRRSGLNEEDIFPSHILQNLKIHFTVTEALELEIGDSVRVEALQMDLSKISVLSEPDLVILSIVPPHVEEEPEVVVEEEEELEEPELIKKGKAEEEEETEMEGKGKDEEAKQDKE